MKLASTLFGVLLAFGLASASDETKAVEEKVLKMWGEAAKGDAAAYHSYFADGVEMITNGEVDEAPWGNLGFITDLFTKVRYGKVALVHPVAKGGDNTYFMDLDWYVTVLATGQQLPLGTWSQQYTFNSAGKISKIQSVCNGALLEKFGAALQPPPPLREDLEKYFQAWAIDDAATVVATYAAGFKFSRNGKQDMMPYNMNYVVKLMQLVSWKYEILDFAVAGSDSAVANLKVTVTPKEGGEAVEYLEGWYVTWMEETDKLLSVAAVSDSADQFDAMSLAFPQLVELKAKMAQKQAEMAATA